MKLNFLVSFVSRQDKFGLNIVSVDECAAVNCFIRLLTPNDKRGRAPISLTAMTFELLKRHIALEQARQASKALCNFVNQLLRCVAQAAW